MAELRIRNMPERVRKALRIWSVEAGTPMNTIVIETLTKAVDARAGKANHKK